MKEEITKVGSLSDKLVTEIQDTASKLMSINSEKELEIRSEGFLKMLYQQPPQNMIQHRQNYRYVPISYIESTLDRLFLGRWKTDNFQWSSQVNEMVGSIDLHVFNPVTKDWITRTGTAAIAIRQKRDSKVDDFIQTKLKNALEQDFPHLKADCIKNAAGSLGVVFGRDLNRDFTDRYNPMITSLKDRLEGALQGLIKAANEDGIKVDEILKNVGYTK